MRLKNYVDTVKNRMSCLSWVLVKNGLAHTTDLKVYAIEPTELPDGFYVLTDLQHGLIIPLSAEVDKFPKLGGQPVEWHPMSSDQAWAILDAFACISDDECRYYMNGIYIDSDGRVVATDGRRLSVEDAKFSPLVGGNIIPNKPALKRFLKPDRKRERLEIATGEKRVWFRRGQSVLAVDTIEGQFPNVNRVIPDGTGYGDLWFEIPEDVVLNRSSYLSPKAQRVFFEVDGRVTVEHPEGEGKPRLEIGRGSAVLKQPVAVTARFLKDARKAGGRRALVQDAEGGNKKALIVNLPTGARQIIMPMQQD